jgi:peptide chain release factor 1
VAVVEINSESEQCGLNLQHVKITTTCGGGPGGQAVNKQETTVIAQHIPTGLRVRIQTRSQGESKRIALNILEAKVQKQAQEKQHAAYAEIKSQQLGTGGRGDKVRTYNFIDCWVLDHRTGKRSSKIKEIMKGHLEEILT